MQAQKLKEETKKETNSTEHSKALRTLSIALPGSILDNAQSPELRTYLAGQVARAAVIFNVHEIIVFNETGSLDSVQGDFQGVRKKGQANVQMARILQYLECPQYLRKSFFPQHKDLQYAGILNPLDCHHHMRADDPCQYREGVTLDKPVRPGKGSFVNVGLHQQEVQIDKHLQPGIRVTVRLLEHDTGKKTLKGQVVSPFTPEKESGLYWGYTVRLANSLGAVFTGCPYKSGYDLTVGTSEKGTSIDDFKAETSYQHALIVFGGRSGLEASLESDESLSIDDPNQLFQHYVNTCPGQGCRTLRTEERILITLSSLRPKLQINTNVNHGNNKV